MGLNLLRLTTILLTAVALGAALAHLFAMPTKLHLSGDDYFTVQQIYAGWNRLGLVIALALLGSIAELFLLRGQAGFRLVLAAATLITASLAIFFLWIFPANQATSNWTQRPPQWESIRQQWEYGHSAGAALYFLALACLVWSAIAGHSAPNTR